MAHQTKEPMPIQELAPDVPDGLAAVVGRLMAKSPEDRYGGCDEIVEALEPYLGDLRTISGGRPAAAGVGSGRVGAGSLHRAGGGSGHRTTGFSAGSGSGHKMAGMVNKPPAPAPALPTCTTTGGGHSLHGSSTHGSLHGGHSPNPSMPLPPGRSGFRMPSRENFALPSLDNAHDTSDALSNVTPPPTPVEMPAMNAGEPARGWAVDDDSSNRGGGLGAAGLIAAAVLLMSRRLFRRDDADEAVTPPGGGRTRKARARKRPGLFCWPNVKRDARWNGQVSAVGRAGRAKARGTYVPRSPGSFELRSSRDDVQPLRRAGDVSPPSRMQPPDGSSPYSRRRPPHPAAGSRRASSRSPITPGRYSSDARSTRAGQAVGAVPRELHGPGREEQAKADRPDRVGRTRQPGRDRQQADRDQRGRRQRHGGGRRPAGGVGAGQHPQAAAGVVVAVHPGDGQEVRDLPEEQQQEQCRRPFRPVPAAGGAPADDRRQRPGTAPTSVFATERVFIGV